MTVARAITRCGAVLTTLLSFAHPFHADITGKARVIDGDTIEVGNERVRIHGIDAPEARQTCTDGGREWTFGREATFALAYEVGHHWVTWRSARSVRHVSHRGLLRRTVRPGRTHGAAGLGAGVPAIQQGLR